MSDDERDEYERSRADDHLLRLWALHSEDGTYWAWVNDVARHLPDDLN